MTIAACPKCGEPVRVPDVAGRTRVACPLCQDSYLFEEVLSKLPPMLRVLDPPASTETPTVVMPPPASSTSDTPTIVMGSTADARQEAGSPDDPRPYELQEPPPAASAIHEPPPASPFDFGDQPPTDFSQHHVQSTTALRPKANRRHVATELIKIALGGIAGLIIAQAILWWLPAGWRRDPLHVAPRLPGPMAFLAPPELRVQGSASGRASQASGQTTGINSADLPPRLGTPPADSQDTVPGGGPPAAAEPDVSDLGPAKPSGLDFAGVLPAPQPGPRDDSSAAAEAPSLAPPATDNKTVPKDAIDQPPPETSVDDMLRVVGAPSFTYADLGSALDAVQAAMKDWTGSADAGASQRYHLAIELFQAFYHLAWKATFADAKVRRSSTIQKQIDSVLVEMARGQESFDLVGNAATSWLGAKKRSTEGVLLSGTVKSIAPRGLYFAVTLEVAGKKRPMVTVLSRTNPSLAPKHPLEAGDRILLLGAMVTDPSHHIIAYEGNQPMVIWSGPWVVLPPAAAPQLGPRKK